MDTRLNVPTLRSDSGGSALRAIRLAALVALTIAAWARSGPRAHAANCITGAPSFQINLTAGGTAPVDICQTTPIAPTGIIGDAANIARARASVGSLGALASSSLAGLSGGAGAHARFIDDFPISFSGTGVATLVFTAPLTGTLTGGRGASVSSFLSVTDLVMADTASAGLNAAGVGLLRLAVPLGVPDSIQMVGDLVVDAFPTSGLADSDFFTSLDVTKIQLFDASGALLDGSVALTDAQGRSIPVAPTTAIPEPATVLTFGIGMLWLALTCWRRRDRSAPQMAA
jgi:hypothetical protein